ncbi:MAG: hypothetical protein Kow00109_20060 [Acidobacteriota bacterium]
MSQPHETRPEQVDLYLIKPSCYDDEGYIVRYFRGVLPSNTLACLAALTKTACQTPELSSYDIAVHLIDETVMAVNTKRIRRRARRGRRTVVGLVGVQTHQYPRALDLARTFRAAGIDVLIGGFHVSGQLAMNPGIPPEIQEALDLGVIVVQGEVEETWGELLRDVLERRAQPLYRFEKPDLSRAPIPRLEPALLRRFAASNYGTIDCGRGCPFECSFCTIINVQGRKMRFRSPELIAEAIRENWRRNRVSFYFFTDDNFARNKQWEAIFDTLIALREEEGIPVEFMMQVDVLSYRIKGFIEKARRAGCSNVFIGMESVNDDNLQAAGKRQNKVDDFRNLIEAYRSHEIATHTGYILGFPFDTPESVRRDVHRLMYEVGPDMASFFILVPLPGSRDHQQMVQRGEWMDPDYNRYDSQHETMCYPGFPEPGQLLAAYQEAWETFYSFDHMVRVLARAPARNYWNLFRNFIWYRSAALIEGRHPMMTGFLRLKGRTALRPGVNPLPRHIYYLKRTRELARLAVESFYLLVEMQLVWLMTRKPSAAELRVLEELQKLRAGSRVRTGIAEIRAAYLRAKKAVPDLKVPSRIRLFWEKWNPFVLRPTFYPRDEVLSFWDTVRREVSEGRFWRISPLRLAARMVQEVRLSLHFGLAWRQALRDSPPPGRA